MYNYTIHYTIYYILYSLLCIGIIMRKCIIINNYFVTSFREKVVLLQFDALGPRVFFVHASDQVAVEDVELLPTFPSDGAAHGPHDSKQEETLQPHSYLLAGQLRAVVSRGADFIWTGTWMLAKTSTPVNYQLMMDCTYPGGRCTASSGCWPSGWGMFEPRSDTPCL